MTATDLPVTERIVVGVDGSEPSRHALRWARFLAGSLGVGIDAVATWQLPAVIAWGGYPMDWDPGKDTMTMLETTLTEVFGDDRPTSLQALVCEGSAARVLLDASKTARMLVIGSRGHGGFAGAMLGSVSSACAHHGACPVLVVHGDTEPPTP